MIAAFCKKLRKIPKNPGIYEFVPEVYLVKGLAYM